VNEYDKEAKVLSIEDDSVIEVMNLTNFLKQTDAITAQCLTEQLISFVFCGECQL